MHVCSTISDEASIGKINNWNEKKDLKGIFSELLDDGWMSESFKFYYLRGFFRLVTCKFKVLKEESNKLL